MTEKSDVTVIGLGRMGSVLAQTLLNQGYRVTVWNRTPSKAAPLVLAGANPSHTPKDAIVASPLTILSLTDKATVRSVLNVPGVAESLKGRTIVDLSAGSAAEARGTSEYVTSAGGQFLDGGILEYPRTIGRKDGVIFYAGSAAAFRLHEKMLSTLAGDHRFLGSEPGAAAATYLALIAFYFVAFTGYLEGAALGHASGVSMEQFRSLAGVTTRKLLETLDEVIRRITAQDYVGDQAPVSEYREAFEQIRQEMHASGVGHKGVDAFIGYVEHAQAAKHGDSDISVLFRTVSGRE